MRFTLMFISKFGDTDEGSLRAIATWVHKYALPQRRSTSAVHLTPPNMTPAASSVDLFCTARGSVRPRVIPAATEQSP
jgi:hypothetical protein